MIDRKQLDELRKTYGNESWWKQELFAKNMLPHFPKELEIISLPPDESENYNCFLYALGLWNDETVLKETHGFIYASFFRKLVELGEIIETDAPKNGNYISYEDAVHPGLLTHLGVIDGQKVISKWSWGPLVRHDLLDVPQSYGSIIRYYKSITREKAKSLYEKFKEFNKK